jgi:hypothetical protein
MSSVADELDARHHAAEDAIDRGDLDAYRDIFAPHLRYVRADGRAVGRDSLLRDARTQSRRYRFTRLSCVREALDVDGESAIEIVVRTVAVRASIFFVVHRTWEYLVRGRYTWRKTDGQWRIEDLVVLEQRINSGRWSFGPRPSLEP